MAKELTKEQKRELALANISKKLGKGAIMRYSDVEIFRDYPHFPTGFVGLDWRVLGIGGLAKGRIIEIFGDFSSGKSTMTLHAIASCQKAGGKCAFVDVEHALNPSYAAALGVDMDELDVSQPDSAEEALEILKMLISSGGYDLVVLDSVAALTPIAELESEQIGKAQVGSQARMISTSLRQYVSQANNSGCTVILINQIRAKIGAMSYGPQTDTSGGNAPKFYASVRLELKKIKQLKGKDPDKVSDEDITIGHRIRVTAVKNKLMPPFKSSEYDLIFGEGFSREGELFDLALIFGFIDQEKKTFLFSGEKLGVGRDAAIRALKEQPELGDKLYTLVQDRLKAVTPPVSSATLDEETGEIDDPGDDA